MMESVTVTRRSPRRTGPLIDENLYIHVQTVCTNLIVIRVRWKRPSNGGVFNMDPSEKKKKSIYINLLCLRQ